MRPVKFADLRQPKPTSSHAHPIIKQLLGIAHKREITRSKLSALSGVDLDTLRRWARGESKVTLTQVEYLAQVLGFEVALRKKKLNNRGHAVWNEKSQSKVESSTSQLQLQLETSSGSNA